MRPLGRTWRASRFMRPDISRSHAVSPSSVFVTVKSRAYVLLVVFVVLSASGAGLNAMVAGVWQAARAKQPALRLDSSITAAGQGVTLALLGGFRALVADA